ncbi:MAG: tRNA adenosine(34) deaminase TadA [Oscillospiraceae bacterium]|jgi:tRNA(adenine34) deaminase|nr:tRNA adenosine(34) deaminase TadA [Oscillospiraceae bacterium]
MIDKNDEYFMKKALIMAKIAAKNAEIPVGAVIVKEGEILACGRNRRERGKNALYHAEIEAINKACKCLNSWRLLGCELFVTLEPCPMCAGAIINSRISRVIFGAYDPKAGACGSVIDLFSYPYNHLPQKCGGVLKEQCGDILSNFFKKLRPPTD